MTGDDDESVLIESVLAGAWGCLSNLDDSGEQLSLVRRVLAGQTAFSSRFLPGLLGQVSGELTVRRRRSRVCRTGKPPSPSVWPEGAYPVSGSLEPGMESPMFFGGNIGAPY